MTSPRNFVEAITLGGGGYVDDVEPNAEFKKSNSNSNTPNINIKAILISSIIFIIVVVWFNVITNIFNEAYPDPNQQDPSSLLFFRSIKSFWYALFITGLSLFICLIIYYW